MKRGSSVPLHRWGCRSQMLSQGQALEDGKLKIETKWLYDLENDYDYKLDQKSGILTLNDGENEYKFIANFE